MILNDWHQRDVSFWHGDATCTPLMLGTVHYVVSPSTGLFRLLKKKLTSFQKIAMIGKPITSYIGNVNGNIFSLSYIVYIFKKTSNKNRK